MENVTSNPDVQIISRAEESNPRLLAALDEAIAKAGATPGQGHSGGTFAPVERMDYKVIFKDPFLADLERWCF